MSQEADMKEITLELTRAEADALWTAIKDHRNRPTLPRSRAGKWERARQCERLEPVASTLYEALYPAPMVDP